MSRLRVHLHLLGNKNSIVHLREKRISFPLPHWPTLLCSCHSLKAFEMFDNFDQIFNLLLSLSRPLKVGMTLLGQKNSLVNINI